MDDRRNVFVIHGRDEQARLALFQFLRALDLHPLEWEDIVKAADCAAPYLGDAVATAFTQARAVVVLLTPDDVVFLHKDLQNPNEDEFETRPIGQARPNVLFEAGLAFGSHATRTIIVEIGNLRPFADIVGRNVIRFDGTVGPLQKIAQRLSTAGCAVNTVGADWLRTDRFTDLDAYTREPC